MAHVVVALMPSEEPAPPQSGGSFGHPLLVRLAKALACRPTHIWQKRDDEYSCQAWIEDATRMSSKQLEQGDLCSCHRCVGARGESRVLRQLLGLGGRSIRALRTGVRTYLDHLATSQCGTPTPRTCRTRRRGICRMGSWRRAWLVGPCWSPKNVSDFEAKCQQTDVVRKEERASVLSSSIERGTSYLLTAGTTSCGKFLSSARMRPSATSSENRKGPDSRSKKNRPPSS